MSGTVRVEVYKGGDYSLDGQLVLIIDQLKRILDQVPDDYVDAAEIEIGAYSSYGDPSVSVVVFYDREKTPEEKRAEKERLLKKKNVIIEKERAEYLRLKEVFGD